MTTYRNHLPQANGTTLLTDGGLETTLIFEHGFDLPQFASFPLVTTESGRDALLAYYRNYAEVARNQRVGVVLDTPTWRASADWGRTLGFDADDLQAVNTAAVELLGQVRAEFEPTTPVVISGNVGPRGDGYEVGDQMTVDQAEEFHRPQIDTLAAAGADLVTALTMTYVNEAIGVARAAEGAGIASVISFTVETDGTLPTGQPLAEAIDQVDTATESAPLAYGINCAHPDHFLDTIAGGGDWTSRIGLVRANASRMSHAELDEAEELDAGNPIELGEQYAELRTLLPNLRVMGGCCGTDHGHIAEIANATLSAALEAVR